MSFSYKSRFRYGGGGGGLDELASFFYGEEDIDGYKVYSP